MNTCAGCGSRLERVREPSDIPVGRGLATVELAFDRCVECGEEFVDPQEYAAAQRRAAAAIREDLGLISPGEIRAIRERAGLTQGELEVLLGAGPKAVGRWERGTVIQSGMADKLLRVFEQYPGVLLELQRVQSGKVLTQHIMAGLQRARRAPEQQVKTTLHVHLGAGEGRPVDDQESELYAA